MHIHHEAAHLWFATKGQAAWATCPITENGFVRVASHPGYPNRPGDVPAVLAILRQLCSVVGHQFWTEDVSIRDVSRPGAIIMHSQITDVFLLGLAVHKRGKLATLDQRMSTSVVHGGSEALEVIAARSA
jgi:predicted nucleic acid-binding protein